MIAGMNVMVRVVCVKLAKITNQMQFLVIAVVVSITIKAKDQ